LRIKVNIQETEKHYFFEIREKTKKCLKCQKHFISRKKCTNCGELTVPSEKIRTGLLTKDLKKSSCSCVFGSWFKFGMHWKINYPKSICKHVKFAMKEIKRKKCL